jgi:hypothetical protein
LVNWVTFAQFTLVDALATDAGLPSETIATLAMVAPATNAVPILLLNTTPTVLTFVSKTAALRFENAY